MGPKAARVRKEEREVVGPAQGSCRRNESGTEGGECKGILLGSNVQLTKELLSLFRHMAKENLILGPLPIVQSNQGRIEEYLRSNREVQLTIQER